MTIIKTMTSEESDEQTKSQREAQNWARARHKQKISCHLSRPLLLLLLIVFAGQQHDKLWRLRASAAVAAAAAETTAVQQAADEGAQRPSIPAASPNFEAAFQGEFHCSASFWRARLALCQFHFSQAFLSGSGRQSAARGSHSASQSCDC